MKTKLSLVALLLSVLALDAQIFTDETDRLNNTSFSGAPCVVDMNADGLDDIVTFENSGGVDMHIDYQQADGTFVPAYYNTNFSYAPTWSVCAGDLDQNGYNDIMVGNGSRVSFLKANDTGTGYTEQLINDYIFSQRTNLVDIDNDGDLDAFACHDVDTSHPYRNDGTGNMVEDQALIQTVPLAGNYASVWTDFDNDGDLDMHMSKCRQGSSTGDVRRENALYVNDGNGNYVEDASSHGLFDNEQSWVTVFEDFDNDGDMDTYTVNHTGSNYLRKNDGTGHYTEVTAGSGIQYNDFNSWACVGADFDNDGYIDILNQSYAGNQMYMNQGDNDSIKFSPISLPFDRGGLGDLNNDGYIDVFTGNTLWINNSHLQNNYHWSKVGLQGTTSNINGIGSRIEIYGDWGLKIRESRSGENFAPMSSLDIFFGLGDYTSIDSLVVRWPSGQVDVVYAPAIDTKITVVETPFESNIRMTRVDPSINEVTIKNFGASGQDISDYRLCSNFSYTLDGIAEETTLISGDHNLGPGEEVTVKWITLGAFRLTGDDMGLYLPEGSFTSPSTMVDYMQYITLDGAREGVAVAKGIWTDDETVTDEPAYTYFGDGTENGAAYWEGETIDCSAFATAPVDLTKSFDPVDGIQDRVQVKWFKESPFVRYSVEDNAACDIEYWAYRYKDNPEDPWINIPPAQRDTSSLPYTTVKKNNNKELFKWPLKFRLNNGTNQVQPNHGYRWRVRCYCDQGALIDGEQVITPWSEEKFFNTPDFDPSTGIYTPPGMADNNDQDKSNDDLSEKVEIYPNPTDGILNLKLAKTADVQYRLIDLSGRTIAEEQVLFSKESSYHLIDIQDLPTGLYMLSVQSNGDITTHRIVKK